MAGESRGRHIIPAGGTKVLIDALFKAATSAGAEIRCSSEVERILINGTQRGLLATGIRLKNGETISANHIISATDPKQTFLNLVGVEFLDIGFTNRIRRLRSDGYVAKLHLALDGMPEFTGLDKAKGRMIIAPTMDAIEFAFDDAKYGESAKHPVMEIVVPSIYNNSLAPSGQHVLSAHVMYIPYQLKGGWTDSAHVAAAQSALDTIERYAPQIRNQVLHYEFLTPANVEREFNVTGGHWHHADIAMDQMLMMRPTYEAAQYRTPIPGLYLCSAGCHPGGDISGLAGHNAAREILK
jgi:phytoene dehydrogenase-like protein